MIVWFSLWMREMGRERNKRERGEREKEMVGSSFVMSHISAVWLCSLILFFCFCFPLLCSLWSSFCVFIFQHSCTLISLSFCLSCFIGYNCESFSPFLFFLRLFVFFSLSLYGVQPSDYILAGKIIRYWHHHTTTPNTCSEGKSWNKIRSEHFHRYRRYRFHIKY